VVRKFRFSSKAEVLEDAHRASAFTRKQRFRCAVIRWSRFVRAGQSGHGVELEGRKTMKKKCDQAEAVDPVEALRLEYEYVRGENMRLRDGRGDLTRQLGPLPIGAAIVAGLVTGFTTEANENWWLWAALIVFAVMVVVSILYSSMKPYRVLREEVESRPRSQSSPADWYRAAIALEKDIYGSRYPWRQRLFPAPLKAAGLQDGYDRERSGLFIVQALFAIVVVLLIISRVTG
jgi:hypothetical protein